MNSGGVAPSTRRMNHPERCRFSRSGLRTSAQKGNERRIHPPSLRLPSPESHAGARDTCMSTFPMPKNRIPVNAAGFRRDRRKERINMKMLRVKCFALPIMRSWHHPLRLHSTANINTLKSPTSVVTGFLYSWADPFSDVCCDPSPTSASTARANFATMCHKDLRHFCQLHCFLLCCKPAADRLHDRDQGGLRSLRAVIPKSFSSSPPRRSRDFMNELRSSCTGW